MEKVKTCGEYTIYKKRSGRYGVHNQKHQWVNGEEKSKLLAAEGLIKLTVAKPKEEAAPEENAPVEVETPE